MASSADHKAQLRAELLRWSLCKTFVHQFSVIAAPQPAAPADKPARRGKRGQGERNPWRPYVPPGRRSKPLLHGLDGDLDAAHGGERAALEGYFSARIEATRHSLPRGQVEAAMTALHDERRAAMRALTRHQQQKAEAFRAAQRMFNEEPEQPANKTIPSGIPLVA